MNDTNDKYQTIDGIKIRYQVHGHGPKSLLLIHGVLGSLTDFYYQVDAKVGLSHDEFTIVALDLPGYGKSDAEERDFSVELFERDADVCAKLMSNLKFVSYAVCGWDDGARVACLLAIACQSRVDTLILVSFAPMTDPELLQAIGKTRDVTAWDNNALEMYSSVYGKEKFSHLWRKYIDYMLNEDSQTFDIRDKLSQVRCPTLIVHGSKDPIVSYERHVKPVVENICDSDVACFKDAAHNVHQSQANRFNQILTKFICV